MDLAIDCWRFNDQRIDAYIVNNLGTGPGKTNLRCKISFIAKYPLERYVYRGLDIQPLCRSAD